MDPTQYEAALVLLGLFNMALVGPVTLEIADEKTLRISDKNGPIELPIDFNKPRSTLIHQMLQIGICG